MTEHNHIPFTLALPMLLRLAWRNLWRHRRRTLITLSSIAIGCGLAVLSIGLGDGSHNAMVRNAIRLGEGHLTVQPRHYLEAPANHRYLADGQRLTASLQRLQLNGQIAPRISLQVLVSSASNSVGAGLEGLSGIDDPRAQLLESRLISGSWLSPEDNRGVLIGSGMARKLKLKVGSKVVLMAGTRSGDSQAQLGRVRGIFDARVAALDDFLLLSSLPFARYFLITEGADPAQGALTRLAIFLDNPDELPRWKDRLTTQLADEQVAVLDWREMMPQLVQFILIDNAGNYIFLLLILIMVVFGIINTVLMSVLERTREFGLLRALGLSRHHLLLLVAGEAWLLSLLAVSSGWLVGGAVHLWFARQGLDFSALMPQGTTIMGTVMDPVIYPEFSAARALQLTLTIFITTLASGIYPAIKAARVTPVEALRT